MAESEDGLPNMLAKAIRLQNDTNFYYNEPIYIPDTTIENNRSSIKMKKTIKKAVTTLKVFPNPAKDYFIVEYKLKDDVSLPCQLKIVDANGRDTKTYTITNKSGQLIINTKSLIKGLYHCYLLNKVKIQADTKIIIN